jgi:hypothetical protein
MKTAAIPVKKPSKSDSLSSSKNGCFLKIIRQNARFENNGAYEESSLERSSRAGEVSSRLAAPDGKGRENSGNEDWEMLDFSGAFTFEMASRSLLSGRDRCPGTLVLTFAAHKKKEKSEKVTRYLEGRSCSKCRGHSTIRGISCGGSANIRYLLSNKITGYDCIYRTIEERRCPTSHALVQSRSAQWELDTNSTKTNSIRCNSLDAFVVRNAGYGRDELHSLIQSILQQRAKAELNIILGALAA